MKRIRMSSALMTMILFALGVLGGANPGMAHVVLHDIRAAVLLSTGEMKLIGGETSNDINFYEVTSASGQLTPADWLVSNWDAQNLDPVGGGDDPGETWDVVQSSSTIVSEQFLLGSSLFELGRTESMGNLFDTTTLEQPDLVLTADLVGGASKQIPIEYNWVFGDTDLDGDLDVQDINQAFWHVNFGAPYRTAADLDMDGDVDRDDVTILLGIFQPPIIVGDGDGDGLANLIDLNIWLSGVPNGGPQWEAGDWNGDGEINLCDLNIWLASPNINLAFDLCDPPAHPHMPEPASAVVLAVAAVMVLGRRQIAWRSVHEKCANG